MPLRIGNTTLSNPFLLGAGMGLLGQAGQPFGTYGNPFALALQEGLRLEDIDRERRLQEEELARRRALEARAREMEEKRLAIAEQDAGRRAAEFQRKRELEEEARAREVASARALRSLGLLPETVLADTFEGPPARGELRESELTPGVIDLLLGQQAQARELELEESRYRRGRRDRAADRAAQLAKEKEYAEFAANLRTTPDTPKPLSATEDRLRTLASIDILDVDKWKAENPEKTRMIRRSVMGDENQVNKEIKAHLFAKKLEQGGKITITARGGGGPGDATPPTSSDELEQRMKARGANPQLISQAKEALAAGKSLGEVWETFLGM